MALLLTAFALLERVVRIVTEPAQHESVFPPVQEGLRVRLAAALALQLAGAAGAPASADQRSGPPEAGTGDPRRGSPRRAEALVGGK